MTTPDRSRALLFEEVAERYDRIRPGYPVEAIDEVLGASPAGRVVLDVGCGTGIASRQLAAGGAQVLGVELNPGMAAVARRSGVDVEVSAFEDWEPKGRRFDRVCSAQAWHWVDPVAGPPKAASVLRRDGRLCVFWSMGHHPDELDLWLEEAYLLTVPDAPLWLAYGARKRDDQDSDFSAVVGAIERCGEFEPPEEKRFAWDREYTTEDWVSELMTHSDHAALPADTRSRLFDEIGRVLDRFGGRFTMSYTTVVFSAARR